MKFKSLKALLPEYPRTIHLPWKPNAVRDDLVAKDEEADIIFTSNHVYVEEKVDGANCAMMLHEDQPIIRNRTHILNKGYIKDTPAKIQFRPAWNWFYENKKKFEALNVMAGRPVGVYGEWMYALHGIVYDRLPTLFLAYDVYDCEAGKYLDTAIARDLLHAADFFTTPLFGQGPVASWERLESLCNTPSVFSSSDKREGLYIKVSDGKYITHRFKMVRSDFVQGCNWNEDKLTKNKVV